MSVSRKPFQPLPALPSEEIRFEAVTWVAERLRQLPDPASVVAETTKIIDEQMRPLTRARLRRDQIALSIREYGPDATEAHPVRLRNVRLAEAAGISRPRLQTLRAGLREQVGGVPLVLNARRDLPKFAQRAAMHEARIEASRVARDAAIVELIDRGWKNVDIAKLMNRDPSRAAHLRKAHNAAALA